MNLIPPLWGRHRGGALTTPPQTRLGHSHVDPPAR